MSAIVQGKETPGSARTEFNMLAFVVKQLLAQVQTITLVKVIDCTNAGGISAVGTVTVQPLVNQISGNGQPTPHGLLYKVPYFRLQGGTNAVILDPVAGDIGMCAFCSRDISTVKATKAQANPPSPQTMFDWADGLYLGGFLNGVPQQYFAFDSTGITVVSPMKITLQAPTVEIDASTEFHVVSPDSEFSGNIHTPETITGDTDVVGDGTSLHTHVHSGVQTGGGDTGPPV